LRLELLVLGNVDGMRLVGQAELFEHDRSLAAVGGRPGVEIDHGSVLRGRDEGGRGRGPASVPRCITNFRSLGGRLGPLGYTRRRIGLAPVHPTCRVPWGPSKCPPPGLELAMIYVLAALVPPLGLLLNGQPISAVLNFVLLVVCILLA